MKLILSQLSLEGVHLSKDAKVRLVSPQTIEKESGNPEVVAIVGSRALAIRAVSCSFPQLKLIQLTSAGADHVPCAVYQKRQVAVSNAADIYSIPIAETVVFGMLTMAKKLRANPNNRRLKLWRHYRTITELAGKQVLILGAGGIGTAVAKRLAGFELTVDGYDPYCKQKPEFQTIWRTKQKLCAEIGRYDYLVSALPDVPQTKHFFDASLLSLLKPTAVVVSVGRMSVFEEEAFYDALSKRRLGGAVLDIFEKLPNPIQNRYRRLSNVVVLPGVAAISQEVQPRLKRMIAENIHALLAENPPKNIINGVELFKGKSK